MDFSNINWGRLVLAWIGALVALAVADIVIHAVILMDSYQTYWTFARPEEEMPIVTELVRWVVWSFLFVWIYTFGIHPGRKGWLQGMNYGFLMGLFFWLPYSLISYTVLPIPPFFIGAWTLLGTAQFLVMGIVVGFLYKTKAQSLLQGDV